MGLKTVLLTGDSRSVADRVGKELGADEIASELLPAQKLDPVNAQLSQGHTVAMIGDGINDAPPCGFAPHNIADKTYINPTEIPKNALLPDRCR